MVSPRKSRRNSACFSSTTTSTPARASKNPSTIPAGPPPTKQQRTSIAKFLSERNSIMFTHAQHAGDTIGAMNYYGAKDLGASFRTVRKNTLTIAEEIPEDKYNYRAVEGTKTVGEMLTHIAFGPKFQEQINL